MSTYNWGNPKILGHYKPYINYSFEEIQDTHLVRLIKNLHKKHNNVKDVDTYYVVPSLGCAQLLWAYAAMNYGLTPFSYPCFSFTNIISDSFSSDEKTPILITSPNNPDGKLYSNNKVALDASYHWSQYYNEGEVVPLVENPIILFSYAKLIGDCQKRLGWALVKDKEVAVRLHEMVHTLNCGFPEGFMDRSIEAVVLALDYDMEKHRKELTRRNKECKEILGDSMLSERGMFLYLKSNKKFAKLDIGMTGDNFGDNKNNIRVNLACDTKEYKELIKILKECYK